MAIPPPPPGFTMDAPASGGPPPPPPGFTLDAAPDAPEPAAPMSMRDFQTQVLQRVRAGERPEAIRAWAQTLQPNPDTPQLKFDLGPDLETTFDFVQANPNVPVQMQDVTDRDGVDEAMAGLRGAADAATLNMAPAMAAGVASTFGDETFGEALQRERVARELDRRYSGAAQTAGELAGSIATPIAALRAPGAIGRGAQAVERFLDTGKVVSRIGRGAAVGAGANVISGTGAAIGQDESLSEMGGRVAEDVAVGGTLGSAIPALGAAGRGAANAGRNFFRPEQGAAAALREIGLTPEILRERIAEGRGRSLIDVLTEDEAASLTEALSRSRTARTSIVTEANRRMTDLGPGMQEQVLRTGPNAPGTDVALPGQSGASTRKASTPGDIMRATQARGDKEFKQFYGRTARLQPEEIIQLDKDVLSQISLSGRFKADLIENLENGRVTGEQMDIIRRQIDKLANARDPKTKYQGRALREDFAPIFESAFPEARPVIRRYSEGMSAAEGAEIGVNAAKANTDFIKNVDELASLTPLQREGVAPGARASLVAQAYGNPLQSYRLAQELATNPGYLRRLETALDNPQEAQALSEYALQQKQGIDALFAAARIPLDKVDSNLRRAEGLIDVIAATTLGGGGAFKAGLLNRMLASMNIGRGAANKLAENLIDPTKRDAAIAALEKMGVAREQTRSWVRDTFMMLAANAGNEGEPEPGTITVGEPQ